MTTVLDASALLAFLQDEAGAAQVEAALGKGAVIGAANWSEVAQKVRARGADWELARAVLLSYGLDVEPVAQADGERAAQLWRSGSGLSLGDRLCLALASRLGVGVLTADAAWGSGNGVIQIR
ncbi:MAG: type II toxin-antitoxin system VapC family toxin [Beutenbergiaceae bacterium]